MISVIIPVFNEEKSIVTLVNYLRKEAPAEYLEIVIVDGGSTDNTVIVAEQAGAKVIVSDKKGRAVQMNVGAKLAQGDIFYFLHADTFPPSGFYKHIIHALSPSVGAGCFRLKFDHDHPLLTFYSWFTRLNFDVVRFGDQSLFVKKNVWEKVGGFNEKLIVMEDQVIVPALKKHTQFSILAQTVTTSARKYRKVGIIRLQIIFTVIVILFYFGIDQQKIAKFYEHQLR